VNYQAAKLGKTFAAIGHPTRLAILACLESEGPKSVSDLAKPFDIKLAAVMKHLDVLGDAGLIARHKTGRVVRVSLNAGPLKRARDWLNRYERFWSPRLDRLTKYVEAKANSRDEQ
jgi:DNA-binding transcriptional ArsR family regulator